MKYDIPTMVAEATSLLKSLISIPSLSREETQAADFLQNYIEMEGMQTGRKGNNVWCFSPMCRPEEADYTAQFPHRYRQTCQRLAERPVYAT